jgi:hypothetical protein
MCAVRLMSVSLTEDAVRARTKTVTRRLGWLMLKPGDRLQLCRKVMGRRKGEPLERICVVEVVAVRRERLGLLLDSPHYGRAEVVAEGFAGWNPLQFADFFCRTHKGCSALTEVTRIEWRYVDEDRAR